MLHGHSSFNSLNLQSSQSEELSEFHKKVQSSILRGNLKNFTFLLSDILYGEEKMIQSIFDSTRLIPPGVCAFIWSFLHHDIGDFDINGCVLYPRKESPLMLAALYGRLGIMDRLLSCPAIDVNVVNDQEHSVLSRALNNFVSFSADLRKEILIRLLSVDNIDINIGMYEIENHHVAWSLVDVGNAELLRMALNRPECKIRPGNEGTTLLMHAITTHYPNSDWHETADAMVVEILKTDMVNVNAQTRVHRTSALMYAVINKHEEVIRTLLGHPDIDLTLKNFKGQTALDMVKPNSNDIKNIFIEAEATKDYTSFDSKREKKANCGREKS